VDPRIKQALADIINNPNSDFEKVSNAFAYILSDPQKDSDQDFRGFVRSLQINHPAIAKRFFPLANERYVLKDFAFAVDGYSG
jgi:hypothetical protein